MEIREIKEAYSKGKCDERIAINLECRFANVERYPTVWSNRSLAGTAVLLKQ